MIVVRRSVKCLGQLNHVLGGCNALTINRKVTLMFPKLSLSQGSDQLNNFLIASISISFVLILVARAQALHEGFLRPVDKNSMELDFFAPEKANADTTSIMMKYKILKGD